MAEYVKITTGIGEIIAAAQQLGAGGEQVNGDMAQLAGNISQLDTDKMLGLDDLGDSFRQHVYHQPVEGGDGTPMSEATKDGIRTIGAVASRYAEAVTTAMTDYSLTDAQSAADIASPKK
jgi:hypothetical protein